MTRKPTEKRPKSGVLAVISLLMIGSAAIRIGLEAGPALAKGTEPSMPEARQARADLPGAQVLLTELLRREETLEQREAAVLDKEKALAIADQAIETRLVALQEAEEALRETLSIAEKAAETDLTRLTDVYQSMKPKDAAALFETMDPSFAAGFLSRMPPDAAAGVLAGLSPEAAYTISVIMAGRNAAVPQE
ncbi:MotE family protein [Ruegeria sp. MALMAid1280]|uniref:MotE family protein n=1 Tax=Ruegeria sp. MALMAid1280 TaxID=3411634 RepID=UPI003B9E780A